MTSKKSVSWTPGTTDGHGMARKVMKPDISLVEELNELDDNEIIFDLLEMPKSWVERFESRMNALFQKTYVRMRDMKRDLKLEDNAQWYKAFPFGDDSDSDSDDDDAVKSMFTSDDDDDVPSMRGGRRTLPSAKKPVAKKPTVAKKTVAAKKPTAVKKPVAAKKPVTAKKTVAAKKPVTAKKTVAAKKPVTAKKTVAAKKPVTAAKKPTVIKKTSPKK